MNGQQLVVPQWPAPPQVRAFSTTRLGGVSIGPFASLNLSTSTGDDEATVAANISALVDAAGLPHRPQWPRQVHGRAVVAESALAAALEVATEATTPQADAVVTSTADRVCSVRTADCLPVLLCDRDGRCVAAAHAGWRGLAGGVLEATVAAMTVAPARLMAWIGPGIGPEVYEVGAEVRDAFIAGDAGAAGCFAPSAAGRWLADLPALASRTLARAGVGDVYVSGLCTFSDPRRFFSHRRDGTATGRMASGIWIAAE